MSKLINFYLLEYSIKYILRDRYKNIFILSVMSLLVALLASTLLLSNAIKIEYNTLIDASPDIIVVNQKARKDVTFEENIVDELLSINGVSGVVGRVNGEYEFTKAKVLFKIVGVDEFESYPDAFIEQLTQDNALYNHTMLVSNSIKKTLESYYYKDYFNFIQNNGHIQRVNILKSFKTTQNLQNSNLILMPKNVARDIFGFNENEFSDIAVSIKNKDEIAYIANKIQEKYVNAKVIVKEDRRRFFESIYNYRSGFFLVIFIISFFTFFVIIYDKVSGLNSTQKKEIGILKAIGWRVEDILNAKLYEGILISLSAYLIGMIMAYIYVFILEAPYLKNIFLNNYNLLNDYKISFYIDYNVLSILFFLSVPIYIIATIIPSWRVATLDADEVMR